MRKCSNFIDSFLQWTLSRSIAPESVLFMCALFSLSSVLRRQVWIPRIDPATGEPLLGGWDCYPHIYCILVADAGVITKSTSIGFVEELLDSVPHIVRTPESLTTPIIPKKLQESPDASICMIIPEFGTVMEKSGVAMYTMLTNLFDGKKKFEEETISRSVVLTESPVVNLFGATTPDWIKDNITISILSGGFGSRTIWLHESVAREPVLIHRKRKVKNPETIDFEKLKADLIHDLNHISTQLQGPFQLTEEGQDYLEEWYQTLLKQDNSDKQRIKGFIQRMPAYVMKLAMIGKLAHSDDLILEPKDFEWAIKHVITLQNRSMEAFKSIGRNTYVLSMQNILDYIKKKEQVHRTEILRIFNAEAEPAKLNELVDGLMAAGLIRMSYTDSEAWYHFIGDLS